ncbi:MAG: hypothetical protein IKL52_02875, partial [Candidatus Gastranaerophilales bacterium]|nr:hypothetical protein [Candidatus Gastranaerophilales bacterium]
LGKLRTSDLEQMPFVFKKYTDSKEYNRLDYTFVDLDNDINKKLLNSTNSRYKSFVAQLPFKRAQVSWGQIIDMDDEYNRNLVLNTRPIYPEKSKYFYSSLGFGEVVEIDIPVKYLQTLGFSKADTLVDLIKQGKLKGNVKQDGEYFVTINTKESLIKNNNLSMLYSLRTKNPQIKTFKEVAKALNIQQKRLEFAIFSGEFEIINEYISNSDREMRYINIATPKNQEFIRKIRFEQALERTLKNLKRLENQEAKIAKQDIRQRLSGVRMALVWEFMPNTKEIASLLAKRDGFIAKLLIKEDDPNETLTNQEEMKLNAYRKEIWLLAGIDELNEAHKKASQIMKIFNEQGLSAVDSKYLPIFERYGFIIA